MSDQLAAAAQAMGVPQPIVERSARAWATASGASFDDVIAGWAGGEVVASAPAAAPAPAETPETVTSETETPSETVETPPAPPVAAAQPAPIPVPAAAVVEPEEPVAPLPLGARVRLGGRIGAWTGAVLGLFGLVLASTWLLSAASIAGEEGAFTPAVEVTTSRLILAVTLLSIVFGIVVATLSRAAAGWVDRGAALESRWGITVVMGAILGLVLGVAAGAVMASAFSEPVEGAEGVGLMRLVPMAIVTLLGGAFLGWLTSTLVQVVGVPAAVEGESVAEIAEVRGRLRAAISIPLAALVMLGLLVLPLGLTFIRSNEMAPGVGAAILAVFAAASILGVAAMSTSRPTMRISWGELMIAVAGIATVVLIVFAVIQTRAGPQEEEAATETTAATTETTLP
ncbi:MAG: hypothetical protein ACRDVD_07210 [Acidimicrobiia bacterium]